MTGGDGHPNIEEGGRGGDVKNAGGEALVSHNLLASGVLHPLRPFCPSTVLDRLFALFSNLIAVSYSLYPSACRPLRLVVKKSALRV